MKKIWTIAWLLIAPLAWAGGPVFDSHVHLREGETSLGEYEAQVHEAGIELAGLAVMWFGGPHQALAGNPADIRARNDALIALAARHPEVVPVATVHPYDGRAALEELARIAARGIKVLKLHPHTQRFDASDGRVLSLVSRAGELGMVVLMDNAGILPGDNQKLFNLAVQAPKTCFIFAHIGGLGFRFWNILVLARTADGFALDNVYFDISGTVLVAADSPIESEFVWTLRNVGIDRLLLGSDYPQLTLARSVEALEKLGLGAEETAAIQAGNARRLFGLPAAGK
jgi:predicted TIM-barrel fold metal-dependent hydrolase